jgi:hypothetical protein
MVKEVLKRIFEFLEEKGEHNTPFLWKLLNNIPLTKEELDIEGDLNLKNTNITSLPEGLKVGGTLDLSFCTELTSLSKGLKVGGDLNLFYSNITSLPEGLKVGGYLSLIGTNMTTLPKGLEVGDFIFIRNTPLTKYTDEKLREMIKPGFIKGKISR